MAATRQNNRINLAMWFSVKVRPVIIIETRYNWRKYDNSIFAKDYMILWFKYTNYFLISILIINEQIILIFILNIYYFRYVNSNIKINCSGIR